MHVFDDRIDAGRQLAAQLDRDFSPTSDDEVIVLLDAAARRVQMGEAASKPDRPST